MEGRLRPPFLFAPTFFIPYTRAMSRAYFTLLLASLTLPAQAAIYKFTDAEGNVTFTDRYRPGAVKVADTQGDGKGESSPATTVTLPRKRSRTGNPSPADFPRVDRQTQSKRDDVRRTLLLEERNNEVIALAAARASLAGDKPRSGAEQAKLAENRRLHEKNIEMLDKELARIK